MVEFYFNIIGVVGGIIILGMAGAFGYWLLQLTIENPKKMLYEFYYPLCAIFTLIVILRSCIAASHGQ